MQIQARIICNIVTQNHYRHEILHGILYQLFEQGYSWSGDYYIRNVNLPTKANEKMRVSSLPTTNNSDLLGIQLNEAAEVSGDEVRGVSIALSSGDVATGE